MNKAKILMDKREARREARKVFIVDTVGWVLLSLGTAVIALILYTMAVVVLGGDFLVVGMTMHGIGYTVPIYTTHKSCPMHTSMSQCKNGR